MHKQVITANQAQSADILAEQDGLTKQTLVTRAANGISKYVLKYSKAGRILVLAGTGYNGIDAIVTAQILSLANRSVDVLIVADSADKISETLSSYISAVSVNVYYLFEDLKIDFYEYSTIVDGIFGVGLKNRTSVNTLKLIRFINELSANYDVLVFSIDIPSGVFADGTSSLKETIRADYTIVLQAYKFGHFCERRNKIGTLLLHDIGLEKYIDSDNSCLVNSYDLWKGVLSKPDKISHKYNRGHSLILSGQVVGAVKLVARAARRSGSGIATIAASGTQFHVLQSSEMGTLVVELPHVQEQKFERWLSFASQSNVSSIVIGPGLFPNSDARWLIAATFEAIKENDATLILDAGALTAFAENPQVLFSYIDSCKSPVIITPHEGEFKRLFKGLLPTDINMIHATQHASSISNAYVVRKGNTTVIASPSGQAIVNANANPWLATAGSGDVLAGIISGLVNHVDDEAILNTLAAAVEIHSKSADLAGSYIIVEDLLDKLQDSFIYYTDR